MIQAAIAAFVGAFLVVTLCISIGPLRDLTQELAVCAGADRVVRDESAGGDVTGPAPGGGTTAKPTTVFAMRCFYEDGSVKNVGNDKAVLGGIGVSVLGGVLLGLALVGVPAAARSLRRSGRPSAGPRSG